MGWLFPLGLVCERRLPRSACVSRFLLKLFSTVLCNLSETCPRLCAYALWRSIEKVLENMFMAVNKFETLLVNLFFDAWFSAIFTKRHLQRGPVKQTDHASCGDLHTFTALITTTSLIAVYFSNLKKIL